jgi:hypothetical protein
VRRQSARESINPESTRWPRLVIGLAAASRVGAAVAHVAVQFDWGPVRRVCRNPRLKCPSVAEFIARVSRQILYAGREPVSCPLSHSF